MISERLQRHLEELSLSLKEYERIVELLGREPNEVELGMFGALWSEHCGYKHTKALIKKLPTKGKYVLEGPGENAGAIYIGDDLFVAFKIESHNHPSAVEPFQGAATGVGGIVRDILSMGARPIALLDSLRFGPPEDMFSRKVAKGVISGISSYGNCIGVPTVAGDVYFEEGYKRNPLLNVMCVGIGKVGKMVKAVAKGVGNYLVYYGARTGRDGIHGATFASAELKEEEDKRSSVQIGDPFLEKKLIEATLEMVEEGLLVGLQDMGAAGLTSSSCEMAWKGGVGIELFLDKVPKRVDDLTPYEILLSESQERMLAVVEPKNLEKVIKILEKWELEWAVVGKVTDTKRVQVYYQNTLVADIPLEILIGATPVYVYDNFYESPEIQKKRTEKAEVKIDFKDIRETILALLSSPNIASKWWVYEQYDWSVQTNTVVGPGDAGCAVLRIKGTNKGIAVKTDGNGRYMFLDPYIGAMIALAEACRNVSCVGAEPAGYTNNLNFGNPEKPEIYYQLWWGIEGLKVASEILEIPVTGGNASLYNEHEGKPVYPTIVVGVVGVIEDISKIVSSKYDEDGLKIGIIGKSIAEEEFGGSEILKLLTGNIYGTPPKIDLVFEKKLQKTIREIIKGGLVKAVNDISEGGLITALVEMMINSNKGMYIDLSSYDNISLETLLFSETQSRIVIAFREENEEKITEILRNEGIGFWGIGRTGGENLVLNTTKGVINISLEELKKAWKSFKL